MEQKTFSLFKEGNTVKLQIGTDIFALDNNEKINICNSLENAKETRFLFPNNMVGSALMYPNGLIAATISVGKLDLGGTKYLISVYSLTPKSNKYDVNNFMVTGDTVNEYIALLK